MTIVAFIRQSYALSLYIFGVYIKMIKFNEYITILIMFVQQRCFILRLRQLWTVYPIS